MPTRLSATDSRRLAAFTDRLCLALDRGHQRAKLRKALAPLRASLPRPGIRRRTVALDISRRTFAGRGRDAGARTLSFVASTERVARDGDIIEVAGWDLTAFRANPVVLAAHDAKSLPVGRAVRIEKVMSRKERRLDVDVQFAPASANPHAETVFESCRLGFTRALSVGFRVTAHRVPSDEERAARGLGPFGNIITGAELLEISEVPVPADAGALKTTPDQRGVRAVPTGSLLYDGLFDWDV